MFTNAVSMMQAGDRSPSIPVKRMALRQLADPVAYTEAWTIQTRAHADRVAGRGPDTLLLLEHRPVYTMGPRTRPTDWGGNADRLRTTGADVVQVNRGGSVTYHGPGQVVLYPVLRLTDYARGVRHYVEQLESLVLALLNRFGIHGERRDGRPGIWVSAPQDAKIAAIGIRVERGVTLHGVAINVQMDLAPFAQITPCGLTECRVTSMSALLGRPVPIGAVREAVVDLFASHFHIEWASPDSDLPPTS